MSHNTHILKTDPAVYDEVKAGRKFFEIRKNDRDFQVGDMLVLKRTEHTGAEMAAGAPLIYTEGEELMRFVTSVLEGPIYGLADGWVIMSISEDMPGFDRKAQLSLNFKWLLEKFDVMHARLCPRHRGSWQERVEHVYKEILNRVDDGR